jgi:5-bromo-4-chloroindolyl phosphate hydrolysis protein
MATLTSEQRRRMRGRMAGALLFVLPLPLFLNGILALWSGNDLRVIAASAGGYALSLVAALVARRGLLNQIAYEERPFGKSPPLPLKAVAGVLVGLTTFLAAYGAAGHTLAAGIAFAVAAAAGFFLFYGFDPRRRKLVVGGAGVTDNELTEALGEAYGRLERLEESSRAIASGEFRQRLTAIRASVENILKAIEEDPRDLRRARRFLNVYLDGAQKITEQYARTHQKAQSPELEQNFRTLLVDMENTCNEQYEKLLQNDVLDLDVEIEVLTTRLRQEGVL